MVAGVGKGALEGVAAQGAKPLFYRRQLRPGRQRAQVAVHPLESQLGVEARQAPADPLEGLDLGGVVAARQENRHGF